MPLGQHFTPTPAADWMVRALLDGWTIPPEGARALDPACGDGALLSALARAWPSPSPLSLLGVELDPLAAAAAQHNLPHAHILQADALALAGSPPLEDASADLVLLNPPYIGEKGNKALFDAVAARSPRWRARSVARMDLLYYFLHLGLDLLRPGGRMVALTTAYWPSATSAHKLRQDLAQRGAVLRWARFEGRPLFRSALHQQNLALVVERAAPWAPAPWLSLRHTRRLLLEEASPLTPGPALPTDGAPWQPFAAQDDAAWADAWEARCPSTLGSLLPDRQGVVSGLDRLDDQPVFVLRGDEVARLGWAKDPALRPFLKPLLRGSDVAPFGVRLALPDLEAPDRLVLLDLRRGPPPPQPLLDHLAPLRGVLERRREVAEGTLPWWALHWGRDAAELAGPKLVAPRRCARVAFCLDLAGHAVSSDCTFLPLPQGRPLEQWLTLWCALHHPDVARYLWLRGKRKHALMELYSDPLRRLPLPLDLVDGAWRARGEGGPWRELRLRLDPDTLRALEAWPASATTPLGPS
jgi:adenine-specific DNA-methyltransferase